MRVENYSPRQKALEAKLKEFKAAKSGCLFLNYDLLGIGVSAITQKVFDGKESVTLSGKIDPMLVELCIRFHPENGIVILDDALLSEDAIEVILRGIKKGLRFLLVGGTFPIAFDSHFEKYRV